MRDLQQVWGFLRVGNFYSMIFYHDTHSHRVYSSIFTEDYNIPN